MRAYSEAYLNDVVENQGKLFDFIAQSFPKNDTENFIKTWSFLLFCDILFVR